MSSVVGLMPLTDETAVAVEIYNQDTEHDNKKKMVFMMDGVGEAVSNPFIQKINKGQCAEFRVFSAAQTISDYVAHLGSNDKTMQMKGNFNSLFTFRLEDKLGQEYVVNSISQSYAKASEVTYAISSKRGTYIRFFFWKRTAARCEEA